MSCRDGGEHAALRRLGLWALTFIGTALCLWAVAVAQRMAIRREPSTQIAEAQCRNADECGAKALLANIRAANAAEDAADIYFLQLVLGALGLAGVGFTVFYARLAWRAAEGTLEHGVESSRRQLRAYMTPDGASARNFDGSLPVEIEMRFKNTGQTPAYKVNIKGGCGAFLYPGPVSFKDLSTHVHAPVVVGPGGCVFKTERAPLPDHWRDMIKTRRAVLYVYGEMTYEDAFGEARYLNYRYQIGGRQSFETSTKDGDRIARLAPSEEGNDAN